MPAGFLSGAPLAGARTSLLAPTAHGNAPGAILLLRPPSEAQKVRTGSVWVPT